MPKFVPIGLITVLFITACAKNEKTPTTIAINPWPGYEFLYLAQEQGFFEQMDLNIRLQALDSLSDAQRAYLHGRVDGMTSTLIEAVQAQVLSSRPLRIVLVVDYSNGGDVIVARNEINKVSELKGKRVGCEVSSLGIYLLHRALVMAGLELDDVQVVNIEQSHGHEAMANGEIDAYVTYPPISIDILKLDGMHTIFTTEEIPYDIIDVVSVAAEVLEKNPQLTAKLQQAWQMAIEFARDNPEQAHTIMAQREGITVEEFSSVLGDLKILDLAEQKVFFYDSQRLQDRATDVCETLVHVKAIETDCAALPMMVTNAENE